MDPEDEVMELVEKKNAELCNDDRVTFLSTLIERLEMRLDAIEQEMEEELDEED